MTGVVSTIPHAPATDGFNIEIVILENRVDGKIYLNAIALLLRNESHDVPIASVQCEIGPNGREHASAYLSVLHVIEPYRRRGVGRTLVSFLLGVLVDKYDRRTAAASIRSSNEESIAFFSSLGFEIAYEYDDNGILLAVKRIAPTWKAAPTAAAEERLHRRES